MSPLSQQLPMQPGFCPVCLDSSCPVGLHWCTAPDLLSVNLKIMSQVLPAAGGSMRQASTQNWHSGAECWRCWLIMRRPSCVPRVARELGSRSLPLHRDTTLASTLSCSASSGSLREDGSAWQAGICSGECGCPDLPRSRRPCHNQCYGSRPRFASTQR